MNTSAREKNPLRCEVAMDPSFDFEQKVAWAMDAPIGQRPSDTNIQDNFDYTRELIMDEQYVNLPAHVAHDDEVGFELLGDDASDEDVAKQAEAMEAVRKEGKVPFHYEVCYVRYISKATEKNPNRKRATRGRGKRSSQRNISG